MYQGSEKLMANIWMTNERMEGEQVGKRRLRKSGAGYSPRIGGDASVLAAAPREFVS